MTADDGDRATRTVEAVLFDLDGVLTDTAEFHYRAWQQLADEEGIPFDRAANERLRGLSRRESLDVILGDREASEGDREAWMARKNDYYREALRALGPDDLLPGARELVAGCLARGVRVAVASSSRNARTVLDALGITGQFEAILDGHSVERTKPAPDLFLHAARQLGVPPRACAVLEDAASGVDAALAAGMRAVGVGPPSRVGHAHLRFDTVADVNLDAVLAPGC